MYPYINSGAAVNPVCIRLHVSFLLFIGRYIEEFSIISYLSELMKVMSAFPDEVYPGP